jgi:hypothetical protein
MYVSLFTDTSITDDNCSYGFDKLINGSIPDSQGE